MMRVYQAPSAADALSPTPIGATDNPRNGGHPLLPLEPDPIQIDLTLSANPSLVTYSTTTTTGTTTLSGKLYKTDGTGLSGQKVILEQKPKGQEGWTAVPNGTLTTSADNTNTAVNEAGNYSLAGVKPSKITDYRARFAGNTTASLDPAESELQRVDVSVNVQKPAFTYKNPNGTTATAPKVGGTVTMTGTVSPVYTGSVDLVIKYKKSSAFGEVFEQRVTGALDANSKYTATFTVPRIGSYQVRAKYDPAAWGYDDRLGSISGVSQFTVK